MSNHPTPSRTLPEATINEAFSLAGNGQAEALARMLQQHPELIHITNASGNGLLARAAKWGHLNCVALLLQQEGIDVNKVNHAGFSALDKAAYHKHWRVVKALLDAPEIEADGGKDSAERQCSRTHPPTPLLLAAEAGRPDIMRALLAKGAGATYQDAQNMNLLHYAAKATTNQAETMDGAIQAIAETGDITPYINQKTHGRGNTPLHSAAPAENAPAIRRLIENGADRSIKDTFGELPAILAKSLSAREAFNSGQQTEFSFTQNTPHTQGHSTPSK